MRKYLWIAAASSTAWLAGMPGAGAVNGPAPAAVTPQTVKLPDGPGSVRGLANDASVSSFTGEVNYEIPIELPGGAGGLAPKLALHYDGALGNGPLGIGWSLGQVGVRRSLRLGVPAYTDADELELIGLPGGTLVPIGNSQYRAEGQGNSIRGTAVDGGFELVDAAGTRYRLGTSAASRLASGTKVAAWYVERITDVAGHTIDYSYASQNGELYLSAIAWGGAAAFRADLNYEDRPDIVVGWRTGFRIAAARRLASIQLSALGGVRHTVQLTYDQSFALSRLATVRVVGPDGTTSPVTALGYAPATTAQIQVLGNTGGWSLGNTAVSFFDVDKDGAMDLIRLDAGNHRYKRNLGGTFGEEVAISGGTGLTMSSVRMLDLDGDSGAEMVTKSGSTWRSYRIVNSSWTPTDWPGSSAIDLQGVAVADLNGDNRMDAMTISGSGIEVWFGTASGFAPPRILPAISTGETSITPLTAQFPDLNGDGLADAISLTSSGLVEFRGRGDGTFERVGPVAYPWTGTTDTTQIRLADLDRDGLMDLVRVTSSQVFWYRGRADGSFKPQAVVLARPPGADATTVVQLADANGNGSTDIVWSSTSGMWVVDLAGPTNAGLLTTIGNGLGKVQHFDYTSSAQLAWAAEAAGAPWATSMPVSVAVTTTASQLLGGVDPDRTSQLLVRDGIYEPAERRFIGFQQSTQIFPGADDTSTIRIIAQYHPGLGADRVLRGQLLSQRTEDGLGRVFEQVDNTVVALAVDGLAGDPRLLRAGLSQRQVTKTEVGEAPAVVRTRYAFNSEGLLIEERRDGRVTDGVALDGDETILRRRYTAEDPVTGVRDLVCDEQVLDGNEAPVSETQRLFGDSASVAALCQSGNGWVREELGYLAEGTPRWVSLARTSYDGDGNPIQTVTGGVTRTVGYDPHGVHPILESVTPADGQILTWTAAWDDVAGTLSSITSVNGVVTRMTYDGIARLTSIAANDALPHVYYRYSWVGPEPRTDTFTFDGDPAALAALPATWTPGTGWRHAVALTNGAGERLLTATQLAADQWTIGELRHRDTRGRVVAVTTGFAFAGTDLTAVAAPANAATQTLAYDALDRVIDQTLPTGSHKRVVYHPLAMTVAVDGLAPVLSTFDGQNRAIHTERAIGGNVESVDASYDAAGRIVQFRLQGDQVHHDFVYDSLGRLTYAHDPDIGGRTMQYDDGGRLVSLENGAGEIVTYGYDGAGRLLSVDGPGVATRYHYDTPRSAGFAHTGGQLAWVEETAGTVDLGYDAYGHAAIQQRTIDAAGGAPAVTGRETTAYSPSGLVRSLDLGDGVVLPMGYDAAGRVNQIDGVWSVAEYSAADLPMRELFANGVTQRYERDIANRPTRIAVENASGALYNVTATYQPLGSIATLSDADGVGLDHTASFDYDTAGRLTTAAIGSPPAAYQFHYAYDGLQNMIRRDAPSGLGILAGSYQYSASAPRQLSQIVAADGSLVASFAYDAAGRQIQHADKHLAYDALSHLIHVDVPGGSVDHRYGYDGTKLSTRSASGEVTYWITPNVVVRGNERDHYVRVGDRAIAKITTSASGTVAAAGHLRSRAALAGLSLVWIAALAGIGWQLRGTRRLRASLAASLAALAIAGGCGTPIGVQTSALSAARQVFYHATYAAGPELTTDAAGQLVEERRSEPYGAAIDSLHDGAVGPVDYHRDALNSLAKFSDPDTRWSDHGARWLAPDTAQWHTPDPPTTAPDPQFMLTPWALHPYQYVDHNPVLFWDPDGRQPEVAGTLQFTVRRYAPDALFGGGFSGDGRGPSFDDSATARTRLDVTFDGSGVLSESSSASPSHAVGWFARYNPGAWGKPLVATTHVDSDASSIPYDGGALVMAQSGGANPLMHLSPNIDTQVTFLVRPVGGGLQITGKVSGNSFPAGEYYITDHAGQSLPLGVIDPHGSPYTSLWGADTNNVLSKFTANIALDKDGNIDMANTSVNNPLNLRVDPPPEAAPE